jgi:hypothetical protein
MALDKTTKNWQITFNKNFLLILFFMRYNIIGLVMRRCWRGKAKYI